MHIRTLATDDDLARYEAWVRAHPQGSLWQSIVRKKYLEACGREVRIYVGNWDLGLGTWGTNTMVASALVVIDRTTGGYSTWEIPRGPLWSDQRSDCAPAGASPDKSAISRQERTSQQAGDQQVAALIEHISHDAKKDRCIALYLSPPIERPATSDQRPADLTTLKLRGATLQPASSDRHVHAMATRIIDLTKSEDEILAQMHPKGRYNINVAKRHGITVTQGSVDDIDAFYALLQATSTRDGFTVFHKSHYTRFLSHLEGSFILLAKHADTLIAGMIGVKWGRMGIYYYGASNHDDRHLMAPYLLQWEAMRLCREKGCKGYDLLGIEERSAISDQRSALHPEPKANSQKLIANSHPWAGITEFKRKFGGTIVTYPPEGMIVLRPAVKKVLEWKRALFG